MSTNRFFSGSRDQKRSATSAIMRDIMRIEFQKGGKMDPTARFKLLMKKRLEQTKKKAALPYQGFSLPGTVAQPKKISARTEEAFRQIAMKKAAKEAKALKQMVIVQPRNYANGQLDKKGRIFDIAGNQIMQINIKNGQIRTMNGWFITKYKPKSYFNQFQISDAINKYSPYFVNLRKQQELQRMQQQGMMYDPHAGMVAIPDVVHVHGPAAQHFLNLHGQMVDQYGHPMEHHDDHHHQRGYVASGMAGSVTAWGVMSDNVHGTYSNNVWGSTGENVWGGVSTNVWGGFGAPSGWGQRGPRIWGTGSGKNHLSRITNFLLGFIGLRKRGERSRMAAVASARGGGRSNQTTASARR